MAAMKLDAASFRRWEHKAVTLLGMSGVGKTRLARILRKRDWFHFSGDYRIGTRYLDEHILDDIKEQAMRSPLLKDLLRSDSIHIANNISIDNLRPLSAFLGKVGNPAQGGIGLQEFKRRQRLHRDAEVAAMGDVPVFIRRAREIYGYQSFVNDAGGSLCELDDERALEALAVHTLILYIKASADDEAELIRRAEADPKPLYYREEFLDAQLAEFMAQRGLEFAAQIPPDDFVRWVFPRLVKARLPRYERIARQYGYTVTTAEAAQVQTEAQFLALVELALQRA
jgi:hypothetical protein